MAEAEHLHEAEQFLAEGILHGRRELSDRVCEFCKILEELDRIEIKEKAFFSEQKASFSDLKIQLDHLITEGIG